MEPACGTGGAGWTGIFLVRQGDLPADSVDLVELVMAMEEEFEVGEIEEEELSGLKTVGDAVNYLAGKLNK